jgi:hypothetical protein
MDAFHADEIATTSTTVRVSWEKGDFRSMRRDGTYYLWIDEAKMRGNPEFLDVWEIDSAGARLSHRRRYQQWG